MALRSQVSQSNSPDQDADQSLCHAVNQSPGATRWTLLVVLLGLLASVADADAGSKEYATKSGIKQWVDPATPKSRYKYTTSRGREWELVMSDEFNMPNRSFRPGDDHIWTSIEKPDGVNDALEIYSHNMTSTECDDESGDCYFYIKIIDEVTTVRIYNQFKHPPVFENSNFFYRAGMVQSWNKFCFQGGLLEVRAQLPGATSNASGNPDLLTGKNGRVWNRQFYPTWPGIWLLGNLGRAIFSASTSRMWPYSYNRCEPDILPPHNQRISACDDNPGYGLNPNQGRGAPEIDLVEGGAVLISSSIQLGPGMPSEFRLFPVDSSEDGHDDDPMCVYGGTCTTPGANYLEVPTAFYEKKRGHRSWYKGLRYGANNYCKVDPTEQQNHTTVVKSVTRGVVNNTCTAATCPMSQDLNSDLGLIDDKGKWHWGVNENGTCHARINAYMGVFLCDPDTMDQRCEFPHNTTVVASNTMDPFTYQMDAISANWQAHVGAYMEFHTYRIEWVTGEAGYIRWMMEDQILFEVTSESVINVTQNAKNSNPVKIMLEEPMYAIFNVALSKKWAVSPPNPGKPCRGNGKDDETNRICDSFPMYMKIDYVRIYQDMGDDLPVDSYMQLGCDPASHPTKGWIDGHIDEYVDTDNPHIEVRGKAFCKKNDDCTVARVNSANLITGKCVNKRCECTQASWGGPRCTVAVAELESSESLSQRVYGPPMELSIAMAIATLLATVATIVAVMRAIRRETKLVGWTDPRETKRSTVAARRELNNTGSREDSLKMVVGNSSAVAPLRLSLDVDDLKELPHSNYSSNFV
jgi:beta-glucanase (GH16 family)